jgi:hypothetical protein
MAVPSQSTCSLSSEEVRTRVLSPGQLQLRLTSIVVAVLLAIALMTFYGVSSIFDSLTPSIRADLIHKAPRAVLELSQTTQHGIALREDERIADAVRDYVVDTDVVALAVEDLHHAPLMAYGSAEDLARIFAKRPRLAHDLGAAYGAWAPASIEGRAVGRVGLIVSKARLDASLRVEKRIGVGTVCGCALALLLCIVFVRAYVQRVVAGTERALERYVQRIEPATPGLVTIRSDVSQTIVANNNAAAATKRTGSG